MPEPIIIRGGSLIIASKDQLDFECTPPPMPGGLYQCELKNAGLVADIEVKRGRIDPLNWRRFRSDNGAFELVLNRHSSRVKPKPRSSNVEVTLGLLAAGLAVWLLTRPARR